MIFVTVGNGQFDPLVQEIDRLKSEKHISEEVVVQIGHGKYEPQYCRWFRFEPTLEKYYEKASFIISHGGPGIVFEVLRRKKKLIALPNRNRTDPRHQVEFLEAMAQETSALLYCPDVLELASFLEKARTHTFSIYKTPRCTIAQQIKKFLELP